MQDDLAKKTDEEIEALMEASAGNAHISGSVYHKYRRELEKRHRRRLEQALEKSRTTIGTTNQDEGKKGTPLWKRLDVIISAILILIAIISIPWWPVWFRSITNSDPPETTNSLPSSPLQSEEAKTLDTSIFQLMADTDFGKAPRLEIEQSWKNYSGLKFKNEQAKILNYGDAGLGKTWVELRSVSLYNDTPQWVVCIFDSEWRPRIQILGKSEGDESIIFSGTILGSLNQGALPIMEKCVLNR